jgi:DNA-binding response OmpR family regulator
MNERILIIDDDPAVHTAVRDRLEKDGFAADSAFDGAGGLVLCASRAPALIVLELALPDMTGEAMLKELRRRTAAPILVLSRRTTVHDRVHGLELGADDYMCKPFSAIEVLARTQSLLRRAPAGAREPELLIFDDGRLEIDTRRREVRVEGTLRDVTRTEFDLLLVLAEQPGRVRSRAEIAYRLRSSNAEAGQRLVDVHIRNLRRKIEDDPARPRRVETIRGRGYRIRAAAA